MAQKPFYYVSGGNDSVSLDTTSLLNVHKFGISNEQVNLGNQGTPIFNLIYSVDNFFGNSYTKLAQQQVLPTKRFNVYRPVTEARYVVGTGAEQVFSIFHTQNFSPKSNFSLGFDKTNSKGYYKNQSVNNSLVYANAYGQDIGKLKYGFDFNFVFSKQLSGLNGGLVNDSTFINDTLDLRNRDVLDVNLENASQQLKRISVDFKHDIRIFNNYDSISNKGTKLLLEHQLGFTSLQRDFFDSILNTSFYNYILNDSDLTKDEFYYYKYSTEVGLRFKLDRNYSADVYAGFMPSYNTYNQDALDSNILDLEAKVNGRVSIKKFLAQFGVKYLINDAYQNNDIKFDFKINYVVNTHSYVSAMVLYNRERPQLDLLRYTSNNVAWSNSFLKQELFQFGLKYNHDAEWKKELEVNYVDLKNPIYFSYDSRPDQIIGISQVIQTKASFKGDLGKSWNLEGKAIYQYQGGFNVFNLPSLFGSLSVDYNFKIFKKKMDVALGASLSYFNKYGSKDFDPVSGQFYNSNESLIGGYPFADVYLKGRVQRATFFIMSSHPHQGLLAYNYFYVPNYPGLDRVFRIGLSWMFIN